MSIAIEMRNITKRFPGITANDRISFQVKKGEIHALLGENGAGKSTLMNILMGLYQQDEGEILVDGKQVDIADPNTAIRLGINMVHQHFMLVEPFTVTENIILGSEPTQGIKIDYRKAEASIREISEKYGLKIDPRALIQDISVGMQQRVEIMKTLYRGAQILIFDEPTAVLTPQEIQELIAIMRNLAKEGRTIILITHKLKEIMSIADTVTIIRRGKVIDSFPIGDTNEHELAEKMVGREVNFTVDKAAKETGDTVLRVDNLVVRDNRGIGAVNGLNLEVHGGEIVGIAGVDGNGQSELIEALTGLRKVDSGRIYLNGEEITSMSTRRITERGMAHIPEDRQKRGVVMDFTIAENMVLNTYYQPPFSSGGFMQRDEMLKNAETLIGEFDVRTPSADTPIRALSGGNQQKAIIAREVKRNPDLLIAAQPTRGLDVGAIEFIHRRLVEQRNQGKAVLLISFELDEVLNLCDRIAVMFKGEIVGVVDPKQTTERELGLLMSGSAKEGRKPVV